jgi:hypothetical protein
MGLGEGAKGGLGLPLPLACLGNEGQSGFGNGSAEATAWVTVSLGQGREVAIAGAAEEMAPVGVQGVSCDTTTVRVQRALADYHSHTDLRA